MGYTWTVLLVVMANILKAFLQTSNEFSQFIIAPILGALSIALGDIVIYLTTELRCFSMNETAKQEKYSSTAESAYYAIFKEFAIAFIASFTTSLILSVIPLDAITEEIQWVRIILICLAITCIFQILPILLRKTHFAKTKLFTVITYLGCVLNACVMTLSWIIIKIVS